ncbi:MAG: hypothetical protein ACI845_002416 [Gammaproteobacteria bacterium]|jgi:hypothetical protein
MLGFTAFYPTYLIVHRADSYVRSTQSAWYLANLKAMGHVTFNRNIFYVQGTTKMISELRPRR